MIWEPFLAAAEAATGARQLANGSGVVDNHEFYLASRDFVDARPRGRRRHPRRRSARSTHGSTPIAATSPSSSRRRSAFPSPILEVAVERRNYGVKPITPDVVAAQQKIADVFFELGLIPNAIKIADAVQEAAVVNAAAELPPDRVNVLWFLPTHGDGRYLGTAIGGRATDLAYLRQIAQAADRLGYFGVLLPTGKSCEDSWIVASAMLTSTERLASSSRCGRACSRRRSRRA